MDLKNDIFTQVCVTPGNKGISTVNGTAVSMEKYNSVVFNFMAGTVNGSVTISLEESANGSTGWTAIEAERLNPSVALTPMTAGTIQQVGITDINKITKNFVRPVAVIAGSTADLCVIAILGNAVNNPAGKAGASSIYIS